MSGFPPSFRHQALVCLLVLTVAAWATEPGSLKLPETFDPRRALDATQAVLKPADAGPAIQLSAELRARGFTEEAEQVLAQLTTTPADLERLARALLHRRHYEPAISVINRWLRAGAKEDDARLLLALAYYGQGELELAERQLNARRIGIGDPVGRLLFQLMLVQRQGLQPGIDANPWRLQTELVGGTFPVGTFPPGEEAKVSAGEVVALADLLSAIPAQGNLWALLGELYNGFGDPLAALAAMDRSSELGYAPPKLLQHQEVLRTFAQKLRASAEAQLAAGTTDAPPPAEQPSPPDSTSVILVIVVGTLIIAFMAGLQIRLWLRKRK